MTLEASAGVRRLAGDDLLGRAGDNDLAAGVAPFGAEFDHEAASRRLRSAIWAALLILVVVQGASRYRRFGGLFTSWELCEEGHEQNGRDMGSHSSPFLD